MSEARQFVIFVLDDQAYGAGIQVVREVNLVTAVTRLPRTPAYVEGVIDLRGEIMPVIDLRKRLALAEREADADTRLMILALSSGPVALVVDAVDHVITLADEAITAPGEGMTVAGHAYVTGVARVEDRLVVILDLVALIEQLAA
jgi:purine-binding chemotaxis protein CheW